MSILLSADDARNSERFPNAFLPPTRLGIKPEPIYFYNIAQRSFTRKLPPNHPTLHFAACPKGEKFALVYELTHPYLQPEFDIQNNRTATYQSGYREAIVMLNPNNPSSGESWKDQDFELPGSANEGANLNKYGLFWSTSNPPRKVELDAAYARLEKTYRAELERMTKARSAEEAVNMATALSHAAADYFKKSFTWHQTDLEAPVAIEDDRVECGACGELIKRTAKYCRHCDAPTDPVELKNHLELKRQRNTPRPQNK